MPIPRALSPRRALAAAFGLATLVTLTAAPANEDGPVRLGSNENAFGFTPKAEAALITAIKTGNYYNRDEVDEMVKLCAAREGVPDALSSDYVPSSLLRAAWQLSDEAGFSLPDAVKVVTRNAARAVGLHDRGEIAPGLRGDLLRVRVLGSQPLVRETWVQGRRVA